MEIKSINIAIAEGIAKLGSTKVVDTVVESLVRVEILKRADALEKAIKLHDDTIKEIRKIKPDQITYDLDGTKQTETYSKSVIDNNKKFTDKLKKIEKTIVDATEAEKWGDLYNLVKGGVNEAKPEKTDDTPTNTP